MTDLTVQRDSDLKQYLEARTWYRLARKKEIAETTAYLEREWGHRAFPLIFEILQSFEDYYASVDLRIASRPEAYANPLPWIRSVQAITAVRDALYLSSIGALPPASSRRLTDGESYSLLVAIEAQTLYQVLDRGERTSDLPNLLRARVGRYDSAVLRDLETLKDGQLEAGKTVRQWWEARLEDIDADSLYLKQLKTIIWAVEQPNTPEARSHPAPIISLQSDPGFLAVQDDLWARSK